MHRPRLALTRKLLLSVAAAALPLSTGLFILSAGGTASAAVPKYDNSADTVQCSSVVLGKITISPALSATGTSPTVIKVSGKMFGCADGNGALTAKKNPLATEFEGVFSGSLSGTSNSIASLSGCSATTGSISISWLAQGPYSGQTSPLTGASLYEPLQYPKTVLTVDHVSGGTFTPDGLATGASDPFGQDNLHTDGYGSFAIGKTATDAAVGGTCATSASESGIQAFSNGDAGANSAFYGLTTQDFSVFVENQENNATQTLSTINLGQGEAYFG